MNYIKILLFLISILPNLLFAQSELLQSGPMLGYSDYGEVLLWVQTKKEATVHFEYWKEKDVAKKFKTESFLTFNSDAFTAKLIADKLELGEVYQYELFINNQVIKLPYKTKFKSQSFWNKKNNTPKNFKLAIGSGVYINDDKFDGIGLGRGGEYHIFNTILSKKPEFMLWIGDNIYLRGGEWNTSRGIQNRYTHTRSLPEMQPLLGSVHNYAIWDDHDFGPNDSDRSFIHKDKTLEGFKLFWGNPSFGLPGQKGTTTMFSWQDVDFFLLDNRYYRSPTLRKSGNKTILGEEQLEWLIDALTFSEANFKMIVFGGLVLSTEKGNSQNYIDGYEEERNYLLKRLEEENLQNVFFLTGDKHFSEASKIKNDHGIEIFEICFSALTSRVNTNKVVNYNQIEGSLVQKRNFGLLEFSGSKSERKLTVTIYDSYGKSEWSRSFNHIPKR